MLYRLIQRSEVIWAFFVEMKQREFDRKFYQPRQLNLMAIALITQEPIITCANS